VILAVVQRQATARGGRLASISHLIQGR